MKNQKFCAEMTKKSGELSRPIFIISGWPLVNQLVALTSKSWKEYAIAVAALDSYLENLEFWFQIVLHSQLFLGFTYSGIADRNVQPS